MASLSYAKYGKDNVRVCKVLRDTPSPGMQTVVEFTVCTLLEGAIDRSYTHADNGPVVPTDTQKQTCYIIAKQNPVTPPELYAALLAEHFVRTYEQIHVAHVSVVQHKWTRMLVAGKEHPHSFLRDGEDKRTVQCVARQDEGKISLEVKSGIKGLLVMKSTGSAFYGYDTSDPYTILPETNDRILSTEVECLWQWNVFAGLEGVKKGIERFDGAYDSARKITLETFANEESPSVQNTMYKMSEQILDAAKEVDMVEYNLPNKHYFEIDLSWHKGLQNKGKEAEVYAPQSDPNGLIHCQVTREGKKLEVR